VERSVWEKRRSQLAAAPRKGCVFGWGRIRAGFAGWILSGSPDDDYSPNRVEFALRNEWPIRADRGCPGQAGRAVRKPGGFTILLRRLLKMLLNEDVRRLTPAFLLLVSLCVWCVPDARTGVPPAPLTTAAAVRMLSPTEASKGLPVRLKGNLLLVTVPGNAIVLLDETEGIYVEFDHIVRGDLRPGDEIAVDGVSLAGDFAPMVRGMKLSRLGGGTAPAPRRTTIAELDAGGFDAAWIELRGIIRSCIPTPADRIPVSRGSGGANEPHPSRDSWLVTFAQGDDQLMVQVNDLVDPRELEDAEVLLRGVVFNVHNANRQFVRASLQVANRSMIEVVTPPPADPFSLPLQPVGEILRFSRTGFTGHRVRVRGVVTGQKVGHTLWLREGDRGIRAASSQDGTLVPGDQVDVVGFPDHGSYTPSLSGAIFRRVTSGPPPSPRELRSAEEISLHDSDLVQIDADLAGAKLDPEGLLLLLEWNGRIVNARILQAGGETEPAAWEPGSRVRAVGICLVGQTSFMRPTGLWVAEDLQLLLRESGDLTVLRAAPWLNRRRSLFIVISVAVFALITGAAIARRQIRQREEARKFAEVEFSAMLAERNRIARDIHDTLAQDLNAVSMQLELAKNSAQTGLVEAVTPHLGTAHQIVRKCLAEARESIWNMRSHILERTDLLGALREIAEQLSAGVECAIRTRCLGNPRRLAPTIENNLLRIGQEAVSNALKHANPRAIDLEITFEQLNVRLVVQDDGRGFDPSMSAPSTSRFGLRGMKERVEQMNGEFHIGRGGTGGTRVEVVVGSPQLG